MTPRHQTIVELEVEFLRRYAPPPSRPETLILTCWNILSHALFTLSCLSRKHTSSDTYKPASCQQIPQQTCGVCARTTHGANLQSRSTSRPPKRTVGMGLKIRIPARVWNAYQPPACAYKKPTPRPKLRLRVPAPPTTAHDINLPDPEAREDDREPSHCKVKLFRFHYGGPHRQRKGQWQNEITYEQPCLQPSCLNCRNWHARLLQEEPVLEDERIGRPAQEPISPEVDPRILDGSWQLVQDHGVRSVVATPGDVDTKTPVLTPVFKSFPLKLQTDRRPMYQAPAGSKYYIMLPTPLVSRTTTAASVRSLWLTTPRKRWTAHLTFDSREAKSKFEMLMKQRERKEKRREYDRARRARLRERGQGGRTVSCRQRVRLVFGSESGKAKSAGAVKKGRGM
jgi:hypothetical protein